MQKKLGRYFIESAAALLAGLATTLFLTNLASTKLEHLKDALFALPMNTLFWIVGGGAIVVVMICVFVGHPQLKLKLMLICWFSANLIFYRLGLQWLGIYTVKGYIGDVARIFALSSDVAAGIVAILILYLFLGSGGLLAWSFWRPEEIPPKAICHHCGGHIAFTEKNLGQKIPCPHCRKETTLRPPENLKMSCFFCHEHIEFPSHAIGEKISCPHCKMGITLKEQA